MKVLTILLILHLSAFANLSAQLQYTSVPRTGEGRFNRSAGTEFWVNPIFLKPSVFFSSNQTSLRANRKWWRNSGRFLPVPDSTQQPLYSMAIPRSNIPSPFSPMAASMLQLKWQLATDNLRLQRPDR